MRRKDNIQWNNDWIDAHFNDYQAISDMYKAYRREVDDSIGCHTFRTHILVQRLPKTGQDCLSTLCVIIPLTETSILKVKQ